MKIFNEQNILHWTDVSDVSVKKQKLQQVVTNTKVYKYGGNLEYLK